ncbi:Protein root UVB sensitive 6, partial [Ananas comosus]
SPELRTNLARGGGGAPETRGIVREAVRATAAATLASSPPAAAPPSPIDQIQAEVRFGPPVAGLAAAPAAAAERVLCWEEVDGRRWSYVVDVGEGRGGRGSRKGSAVRAVSMQTPVAPLEVRVFILNLKAFIIPFTGFHKKCFSTYLFVQELVSFIRSYVVPEGFPDSVTPSYVPYMTWRALKHFFGGAMGVFTTQTLLSSVGVSKNRATPGAVAINWILKDGAGRVGKMLFARQGKKFDYDLKQLRFAGDLIMELGAGVELATAAVPHLFLPLACAANVAKNVAAVTSTSTRTPIYKA